MGLKGSMVKRDCAIVGKSWLMDVDLFFLYDGKFPREDVWNTGGKKPSGSVDDVFVGRRMPLKASTLFEG